VSTPKLGVLDFHPIQYRTPLYQLLARIILKDLVFPSMPARPVAMFLYMYVLRLGLLDGRAGSASAFSTPGVR